jgi:midasin (ATPase involved in ribosome maturation)
MSVDFKTFIKVTPYVTAVRKPVLVRGRHGVGKSQVVYQLAKGLGLPVVERRASQMTEGDLLGLPSTDGNVTSWNPPEWYKTACTHAVVLFLDEVDRATSEVRQGIFELTDSRKLAGFTLHQDTLIFAAVNGGEHGEQYQVGEMDPAELDRWTVFDVEPTTEDWLEWAGDVVHPVIWNFINQNHTHLEHKDDYEPNKVYPSRRSWHRLSECLAAGSLLDEGSDSSIVFNLTNSFVGFEAAVAFKDFVDNYERQVTVEDILDDGKIELTADFGINEHAALITKMEQSKDFQEKLSAERVQNLANYYITLPSEVAMKLWTILGQGHQANSVALHQSKTADGKSVSAFIVELLTGEESK